MPRGSEEVEIKEEYCLDIETIAIQKQVLKNEQNGVISMENILTFLFSRNIAGLKQD